MGGGDAGGVRGPASDRARSGALGTPFPQVVARPATWPGLRGQGSRVRGRSLPPPRPGAWVPHSAAARSVNTRRPPPALRGGGGRSSAPADPHCCASCHARKERRGRRGGRRGTAPRRGPAPAASARVRGGEGSPGAPPAPARAPRPAPAYLPGSLRRLALPAPS